MNTATTGAAPFVAALVGGFLVSVAAPIRAAHDAAGAPAVRANAPARIDDPATPPNGEPLAAPEAPAAETAPPPLAAAPATVERKPIESELIRRGADARGAGALHAGAGRDDIQTGRRSSNYLWRSLSGLAVVVGLIAIGAFVLKRAVPGMKRGVGTEAVTVLGRTYVGPKHALHLVKVGRRILVLGQTPSGVSNVAEIADPDEVQEVVARCQRSRANSVTNSFRNIFRRESDAFDEDAASPEPTAEGLHAGDYTPNAGGEEPPAEAVGVVRQELDLILDRVRTWRRGTKANEGERGA